MRASEFIQKLSKLKALGLPKPFTCMQKHTDTKVALYIKENIHKPAEQFIVELKDSMISSTDMFTTLNIHLPVGYFIFIFHTPEREVCSMYWRKLLTFPLNNIYHEK